jgi:hypothetical protein
MIIAVSGWRNWSEKGSIATVIGSLIDHHWAEFNYPARAGAHLEPPKFPLFRFGDCPTGVDKLMLELVGEWHLPHERYEAFWDEFGKAAGPLRNRAMLRGMGYTNQRANLLLAFPEPGRLPKIPGSGTWGCIGEAAALGIQTVTYPSVKLTTPTGFALEVFDG